jgi:hypothetical protein
LTKTLRFAIKPTVENITSMSSLMRKRQLRAGRGEEKALIPSDNLGLN